MISNVGGGINNIPPNDKNGGVGSSKVDKDSKPDKTEEKESISSANVDRVKEIKEGIKNGTYKVDIDKLSEKMADDLV